MPHRHDTSAKTTHPIGQMIRKLFGTDGARGRVNTHPMTADTVLRLGAAAGRYFRRDGSATHHVIIGKDTRLSGYMFESALTAGFTSTGMNVLLLGPVPTPAVGMLVRSMGADVGVMISASHNPHEDNGVKFFGPDGFKLSDEAEAAIEAIMAGGIQPASPVNIGRARRVDGGLSSYVESLQSTLPGDLDLSSMKVVIDCGNGAAYRAAPELLGRLGADMTEIGTSPDGTNINENCGTTCTATAADAVLASGADVAICLDGDADRVVIIDETGVVADGDQIMALFAARWADEGCLQGNALVTTVMSNLGLERFLEGRGISLLRTSVGDRYVVETMRAGGYNLGGEQSGHIVMTDYATTGDGLLAGVHFLAEMRRTGFSASELRRMFEPVPQLLKNVRYSEDAQPLETATVKSAITDAEKRLAGTGRLLIRKSGTEPLIRVMAECEDEALLKEVVDGIVADVEAVA